MKRNGIRPFAVLVVGAVAIEEVLRHAMAGTSVVATLLSSGEFSWRLIVACIFVFLRLFTILVLPAWVMVRLAAWLWPRAGERPPGAPEGP